VLYRSVQIYTAITQGIPIVALNVNGAQSFNYAEGAAFLDQLDTELEKV
jgi:hypothetical protein